MICLAVTGALYVLERTAVTYEYDVPEVEEFKRRIENTLEKYPYIVAVENVSDEDGAGNVMKKDSHKGRIVGYAYAGCFKSRAAYDWSVETSIYVDNDARKMGIGKMLYAELEKRLKAMNITNTMRINLTEENRKYLEYHRNMIFVKR